MFFGQLQDFLLNAFCFQVNCNQAILFAVQGDQFQNFVNRRNFFSGKSRIEPTADIKLTDFFKCKGGDHSGCVGRAVDRVINDANQMPIVRFCDIKLEPEPQF